MELDKFYVICLMKDPVASKIHTFTIEMYPDVDI